MLRNHELAVAMLEAIEKNRAGNLPLDELERTLWRLLDGAPSFPPTVASRVEDLVLELRRQQDENQGIDDPDRGKDRIYNEVTGALGRLLSP